MMSTQPSPANQTVEREKVFQWILELTNPETREKALLELRFAIGVIKSVIRVFL
mgnify:FL=1